MDFRYNREVLDALRQKLAIVALESTVISHGLPYPQNLETARRLEAVVRDCGATPATIAILGGRFCVGLEDEEINHLASAGDIRKATRRDLAIAVAGKMDCATTVATTSFIAHLAGIKVFATGGIGGVHRGFEADVSADLPELSRTAITVVCSGAKIVLDLARTREWLETNGIPVLGWQCDDMPAFYSRESGLAVDARVDSAADVVRIAEARDELEFQHAILVTVPVAEQFEIERDELEAALTDALEEAERQSITGKAITPFLLSELSKRTSGRTLAANIALLENNARVAAEIAAEFARTK
jgi:pseudouridylate synthase